jgi:V/A-type H+/Na+-transporting ATPase subunit I
MMLRPAAAQWFELLTSREELGAVLDCIAQTRSVQLQAYSQSETRLPLGELRAVLTEQATLARRYGPWWPAPQLPAPDPERAIVDGPQAALATLRAWVKHAEPIVAELETLALEEAELVALQALCAGDGSSLPRLDRLATAGPVLASRIYAVPIDAPPLQVPPAVICQRVTPQAGGEAFVLAVGPIEDMVQFDEAMSARKLRRIALPADLPRDAQHLGQCFTERREALGRRAQIARESLERLDAAHGLAAALGQLAVAAWIVAHVPELPVTEHFAWVTGWCSNRDDTTLRAALEARGLHYLLRFTPPPAGEVAPSVLLNPRWARPFETVTGMMGVPASRDADPSLLVAILAPLMFGFMFGDVGQGAIVAIAGYWFGRKIPALRLLVPGGLVAIVFGFAFGSVFAREDVIPALWLHPLAQPLTLLKVALGFGVVVILIGLLLDALQRAWQLQFREWLQSDAGILLVYIGMVSAVIAPRALWALPIGLAWVLLGAGLAGGRNRAMAVAQAAGSAVERILQMGVNTVSFVRIGAFALAHAGLCAAIVGMAEAAGPAYWVVLLVGNAAIILLEGLVVSIQTTRLVLFEFFIRFLTARGRAFVPLAPPPTSLSGGSKP